MAILSPESDFSVDITALWVQNVSALNKTIHHDSSADMKLPHQYIWHFAACGTNLIR